MAEEIIIPETISNRVEGHDGGFLASILPLCKRGPRHTKNKRIDEILSRFSAQHERVMGYLQNSRNEWSIWNYAYDEIKYNPDRKELTGSAHWITGYDRTIGEGQKRNIIKIDEGLSTVIIPLILPKGETKGIIFAQEYRPNQKMFGVDLLIGDNYIPGSPMPDYWCKKIPQQPPQFGGPFR